MSKLIKSNKESVIKILSDIEEAGFEPMTLSAESMASKRLTVEDLQELRLKIARMLQDARQKSAEANQFYEEAKQKGLDAGFKESSLIVERLFNIARRLDRAVEEWKLYQKNELQGEVFNVIENICSRILKREFLKDKKVILQWAQEGLSKLGPVRYVRIKINDQDKVAIERAIKEARQSGLIHSNVIWLGDSSVESGSCFIETDRGEIDVSLQTQKTRICNAVRGQG